MQYKIIEHWSNADNWQVGDIVDISSPEKLLEEGKIKEVKKVKKEVVKKTSKKKAKK